MSPLSTRIAIACTILLPDASAAQGARPDGSVIAQAVDSLARRAVADGLAPGVGVAVSMDGRIVYEQSIGAADVTAGIAATNRTLWYVASTTKSFIGVGVALLEHQGALRLDAPITTLLPGVPWHADVGSDSLRLDHFLSHTHHINDNAIVMSAAFTGEVAESRWPSLIALAGRMPNDHLTYSNFGYNVAGMVIDATRREGWRRYVEQQVFAPVGMRNTYSRVSGFDRRRIAMPHRMTQGGGYVTEPFFKTNATMNSAGGHLATLHDLARWTIVQMDSGMIDGERVFPAAAIERSHRLIARHTRDEAKRFALFDREGWAAGWDIGSYNGERMVSRFGSYHSTRSHLSFLPGRRIGVVAMLSAGRSMLSDILAAFVYDLEAGRPDARERAGQRIEELRAGLAASRRGVGVQDSIRQERGREPLRHSLNSFVGRYSAPSFGTITFRRKDDRLHYRWGAVYGPAEVFAPAQDQFRLEIAGSGNIVRFQFDESGPARSVIVQDVTFTRAR